MGSPRAHTPLRKEMLERLYKEKYGNYIALSNAWSDKADRNSRFPKPRAQQTINKWLISGGVPTLNDQLFGLCSLLDVDPLAILDYERSGYFSKFATLRQLVYLAPDRLGGLFPIFKMYRPGDDWPSSKVAHDFFGRAWCAHEFTNEDNYATTDYILVKAQFDACLTYRPLAVHIAYKRVGVPDTMWRPYGSVLAIDGTLHLYNESGSYQSMQQATDHEIRFRTYYGGRPVKWRVASLHGFRVALEFPFNDMSTIGFNW
jgi:hypothetical protein